VANLFPKRLILVLALGSIVTAVCGCRQPSASQQPSSQIPVKVQVEAGDEAQAKAYYAETLKALDLTTDLDKVDMTLMLKFMGYDDLTPAQLEDVRSADLMKRFGSDLLSSAFFAPKITDVSQGPGKINVGWRKVIRLRSRAGSNAIKKGIAAGFILFNKFQGTNPDDDPFEPAKHESQTTQLILVRGAKSSDAEPANRPLHFFVYGPVSGGAKLKLALTASFDAAAPEIEAELARTSTVKNYFVPLACGQCHGGLKLNELGDKEVNFAAQKLNLLDTDHWLDRIEDGDDFAFLQHSKFPVLYDSKDPSGTATHDSAFAVLRSLNEELKSQNQLVDDPAKPSFQFRAISKWIELHTSDTSHRDVFARALTPSGTGLAWDSKSSPDKDLLPKLNRLCYRCHSSISYNLFDRSQVACRKTPIKNFLALDPANPRHMPQDRVLDKAMQDELTRLVLQLPDTKCVK
jgi:hypothetical protein